MKLKYLVQVLLRRLTMQDAYLISKLSTYKLSFGKYRGKELDKIWQTERGYLAWFIRQKDTDCKQQQMHVRNFLEIKTKLTDQKYAPLTNEEVKKQWEMNKKKSRKKR